jgi:hypothetical protein
MGRPATALRFQARGTHYQGRGMRQQVRTHLLEMVRTSWYGEQEK